MAQIELTGEEPLPLGRWAETLSWHLTGLAQGALDGLTVLIVAALVLQTAGQARPVPVAAPLPLALTAAPCTEDCIATTVLDKL